MTTVLRLERAGALWRARRRVFDHGTWAWRVTQYLDLFSSLLEGDVQRADTA